MDGADVTIRLEPHRRLWDWLMFHTAGGDPLVTAVTDRELNRYFGLA